MTRLPPISRTELTSDGQQLYDVIAGTRRAGLAGPFSALIRNPNVAAPANDLHNAFRLRGKLDRRLFELIVVMVAHEWSATYALSLHERLAIEAGVSPATIDAVREGRKPDPTPADELLIYSVVREILDSKSLTTRTYQQAVDAFGIENVVEAVAAVGFYSMLCCVLNVFDISVHDNGGEVRQA